MRAMWSGSINFGLVNIPVKLYTALKPDRLHFNYLRKEDLCPIGYKKVCRRTGEEVPKEDIVRGYQYQKGDYVVLDEEDFKKAEIEQTYSITIEDFIDEKEIDISLGEKPYYLEPEPKSKYVYALFREALGRSGKGGIGKFVLKEREHLVLLRARDGCIMINLLRFQAEIVSPSQLELPGKVSIPKNQMELALELIHKLSGPFHPEKYKDTYTERLREIVGAKKKGRKITISEERPEMTPVPDIVSRLKESLSLKK